MLKRDWKPLATYEGFERIASYVVMFFISIIIVYALVMMGINIFDDFKLGMGFLDAELLKDVFGSLLSILILIEFNHSIALSITRRSGNAYFFAERPTARGLECSKTFSTRGRRAGCGAQRGMVVRTSERTLSSQVIQSI